MSQDPTLPRSLSEIAGGRDATTAYDNAAAKARADFASKGDEPILKYFAYEHLPPHLQMASAPFGNLALHLCGTLPRSAERTVALYKLLESKDAAVRAALP